MCSSEAWHLRTLPYIIGLRTESQYVSELGQKPWGIVKSCFGAERTGKINFHYNVQFLRSLINTFPVQGKEDSGLGMVDMER